MALNYNNRMSDFNRKNTDMQAIRKIVSGGMLSGVRPVNPGNRMTMNPNFPNNRRLLPQPYDPSGQGLPDMSGMLRKQPRYKRIPDAFKRNGRSLQDILTNIRQYKGMS